MNTSKRLLLLFLFITGCSADPHLKFLTQPESQAVGSIAFPVFGQNALGRSSLKASGIEMFIVNKKSGASHTLMVSYSEGKWVEYVHKLTPGVYTINEYFLHSGGLPRPLKPAVEILVKAGQTVLSPVSVRMVAHVFPQSWVGHIQDDSFWDDYR